MLNDLPRQYVINLCIAAADRFTTVEAGIALVALKERDVLCDTCSLITVFDVNQTQIVIQLEIIGTDLECPFQ
jgi:hypothetical protein